MIDHRYLERSELRGYAAQDYDVIDYQMWSPTLQPALQIRGPYPEQLAPGRYIVAIGAAQTFGRFVDKSYSQLLAERLGVTVLNLGFAGAGPSFFLKQNILPLINDAALVIVQAMSGRSLSNSVFNCPQGDGLLQRRDQGPGARPQLALDAWRGWMNDLKVEFGERHEARKREILSVVDESRIRWVGEMVRLRHALRSPALLFWFSKREPTYELQFSHPELVLGEFPQLVDEQSFRSAARAYDAVAEAVTSRGSPQPLVSRFTGAPHVIDRGFRFPTSNAYYPSPEMHQDAAAVLAPLIPPLLDRQGQRSG